MSRFWLPYGRNPIDDIYAFAAHLREGSITTEMKKMTDTDPTEQRPLDPRPVDPGGLDLDDAALFCQRLAEWVTRQGGSRFTPPVEKPAEDRVRVSLQRSLDTALDYARSGAFNKAETSFGVSDKGRNLNVMIQIRDTGPWVKVETT